METHSLKEIKEFLLVLTLILAGCGSYPVEKYHPTLLDFKNQKGHVYNTERIKPKPQCGVRSYKFIYAESIPLSSMGGYYCFKNKEVTDALADLDEAERKDCEERLRAEQNKTR